MPTATCLLFAPSPCFPTLGTGCMHIISRILMVTCKGAPFGTVGIRSARNNVITATKLFILVQPWPLTLTVCTLTKQPRSRVAVTCLVPVPQHSRPWFQTAVAGEKEHFCIRICKPHGRKDTVKRRNMKVIKGPKYWKLGPVFHQ